MKRLSWLIQAGLFLALATECVAMPKAGVFPANNDTTGKAKADQYEAWLGRDVDYILQFYAGDNWDYIDGTNQYAGLNWWSNQWVNYPQDYKDRLVIAIPILPSADWNNDHQPDDGSTLALGATGAYNQRWVNAANKLVSKGMGNTTLRLGWEFNGGWYNWNAKNGRQAHFKNYWIHIVNSMRSVPGANFKFCWNPTVGDQGMGDPTTAYPGADYVDFIGIDIYDIYSGYATAGYPDAMPAWQVTSIRNNGWLANKEWGNYHLDWWSAKAATLGKPLCFPEWGLDAPVNPSYAGGYGGKDNTIFITKFQQWINNPANNVAWHAYFEAGSGSAPRNHMIYFSSQFPNCKALFPTLFGLKMRDDFEDGIADGWSGAAPRWSVVTDAGDKAYKWDFDWTVTGGTSSAGLDTWTNYRLVTDAKVVTTNAWSDLSLYVRYIDANNHYRLKLEEQASGVRKWILLKKVAGTQTQLGASVTANVAFNTWYQIGLEANGSNISVFLNGAPIMQRTDTSLTAGRIAVGGYKQDIHYDNVEVQ